MARNALPGEDGTICPRGASGVGSSYMAFECPLCKVVGKSCGELEIWWGTPEKATITICGKCYSRIKYGRRNNETI